MQGRVWAAAVAAAWAIVGQAQVDPLATRGGWEVGIQAAAYEYDEPFFATLEGERGGVSSAYTFLGRDRVFSRVEARFSYGELDYTGSGTLSGVPDYLFEARGLAGRDYGTGSVIWAPYAGLGFRYLYSDGRGVTSTGHIGYRRRSRYFYVPIGVTLRVRLGEQWVLAPQLEYGAFANGHQRSYLSDVSPLLPDVTNQQKRGRGLRGQLALEGPRWTFSL